MELFCRVSEMQLLGHRKEEFQLAKFHGRILGGKHIINKI